MSHLERVDEQAVRVAWKRKGKGKGLRWQLLREVVAILSCQFLTTSGVQDAMVFLRGISWSKTRQLLEELERSNVIAQVSDPMGWVWGAIPSAANYWIDSTEAIPAGIVQVASRFKAANE